MVVFFLPIRSDNALICAVDRTMDMVMEGYEGVSNRLGRQQRHNMQPQPASRHLYLANFLESIAWKFSGVDDSWACQVGLGQLVLRS